jgi:hypothetical protein
MTDQINACCAKKDGTNGNFQLLGAYFIQNNAYSSHPTAISKGHKVLKKQKPYIIEKPVWLINIHSFCVLVNSAGECINHPTT